MEGASTSRFTVKSALKLCVAKEACFVSVGPELVTFKMSDNRPSKPGSRPMAQDPRSYGT